MTEDRGVHLSEVRGSSEQWGFPEFPKVNPSLTEHVLYRISQDFRPGQGLYSPIEGSDKWNDDYVRLPCSPSNQYQFKNDRGQNQSRSRWEMITEALQKVVNKQIQNCGQLVEIILSYNREYKYDREWGLTALVSLFNDHLTENERDVFFNSTLPAMAQLALDLPRLVQAPIPLLKKHCNISVSLTQQQISCLLANAFFCTYPLRDYLGVDCPSDTYPFINFIRLFAVRGAGAWEKLKCICHYFRRVCSNGTPKGVVTFCRRSVPPHDLPAFHNSSAQIKSVPFMVDTHGTIEEQDGLIQLDFANKYLGGGVLGSGNVQEEIRFAICPELLISMLFTEELEPNEAVIMIGAERYSSYSGYGGSFKWMSNYNDKTPYDSYGRHRTAVLAIDAIPVYNKKDEYRENIILRELNKAWVGFSFFTDKNSQGLNYPGVATGNWGCGAFGGSPQLKSLIQLMACAEARRPMAYFTFGNAQLTDELYEIYECLARNDVTVCQLYQHILNFTKEDKHLKQLFAYLRRVIHKQ